MFVSMVCQAQRRQRHETSATVCSVISSIGGGCCIFAAAVEEAESGNGAASSWNVRRSHTLPHSEQALIFAALPLPIQQLATNGGHTSLIRGSVLCIACAELVRRLSATWRTHHAIHRFTMRFEGWSCEAASLCNQRSATNAASAIVIPASCLYRKQAPPMRWRHGLLERGVAKHTIRSLWRKYAASYISTYIEAAFCAVVDHITTNGCSQLSDSIIATIGATEHAGPSAMSPLPLRFTLHRSQSRWFIRAKRGQPW